MKNIVRRGSGEGYKGYLKRLAKESGIANPTDEDARNFDRKRKKKMSNAEWVSSTDPDAEIRRIKDGRTRLAYTAEHTIDMETGAVLAAEILPAHHAVVGAGLDLGHKVALAALATVNGVLRGAPVAADILVVGRDGAIIGHASIVSNHIGRTRLRFMPLAKVQPI